MLKKPYSKKITTFDKQTLFVEKRGRTNHPELTVLILHGLGGDSNSTIPLATIIQKKLPQLQVVSYDLRGHGQSSGLFSGNTIEETGAKDIQAICQQLQLDKVVFVGHSLGGIFVQKYLELDLKPKPIHTFIICTPLSVPPFTISRKGWFKLLKQVSTPETHPKRSTAEHLQYTHTRDFSSSRLLNDLKHTGRISLPLMYLSTMGWKLENPKKIFEENPITLIYGKNDILIKKPKEIVANTQSATKILQEIDSNHHQPYIKLPHVITSIITETLYPDRVNQDLFFSIIVPSLNEARYIPALLTDLTRQQFKRFEVIVVDGGSTDSTLKEIKKFEDKICLKVVTTNQANVAQQRNKGAKLARADWLLFIDADVQLSTTFLRQAYLKILSNPTDSFSCAIEPDSQKRDELALAKMMNLATQLAPLVYKPLCFGALFGVKKKVFEDLEGFNQNLSINEDQDLVQRLTESKYRFQLFSDLKFKTSFRRIRSEGKFKMMVTTAKIHLKGIAPFIKVHESDYPMYGGEYFDVIKSENSIRFEKFRNQMTLLSQKQKEKIQRFVTSLFESYD